MSDYKMSGSDGKELECFKKAHINHLMWRRLTAARSHHDLSIGFCS